MPSIALLIGWALVGWCGTGPRPKWPSPPGGPPDPDPWGPYLVTSLIGIAGGVVGGWVFAQLFGVDQAAAGIAVSLIGAFAGGRIAADAAAMFSSRGR